MDEQDFRVELLAAPVALVARLLNFLMHMRHKHNEKSLTSQNEGIL